MGAAQRDNLYASPAVQSRAFSKRCRSAALRISFSCLFLYISVWWVALYAMVSRSSLRSPNVQSGVQNRKVRLVERASSRMTTRTQSQNELNAAPTIKKSSTKVKVMATDKGVTATIKKVSKKSKEFARGRGHLLHVEEDKMEVMKEEGQAPAIVSKAAAPKQQTVEVVAEAQKLEVIGVSEAQMLAEGTEAQRVKEALREFNTLYLEAIQAREFSWCLSPPFCLCSPSLGCIFVPASFLMEQCIKTYRKKTSVLRQQPQQQRRKKLARGHPKDLI